MDPFERQLDLRDDLVAAAGETCPDCADPGLCQAGGECVAHIEELVCSLYPAWDAIP